MVRERRVPHQHSFVLDRRNPITDNFCCPSRRSGPDRRANFVQCAARRLRDTCKVFRNSFRSAFAFRRGSAFAGFRFLHSRHATNTSIPSSCPIHTNWQGAPFSDYFALFQSSEFAERFLAKEACLSAKPSLLY